MILRRLMQHLKDQPWIALGLDFAIVVLGVFLALAVDSAVDRHNERRAAYAALNALRSDIAADLREFESHAEGHERRSDSYSRLMSFLSGTEPIDDALGFVKDVQYISTYFTFDPRSAALDELINTGGLRLIRNRGLRDALLDYRRGVRDIGEFDMVYRAYFLDLYASHAAQIAGGLSMPYRHRAWGGAMSEDAARAEAERVLDAEEIRSSDHLRQLVVATHAPFGVKGLRYRSVQTQAQELLAMLDEELGEGPP
jgi:hypothetical protein